MTTREAMWAAVLAEPENDLVRLVYADNLEEDGDSDMAEFVRLSIALEGDRSHCHPPGERDGCGRCYDLTWNLVREKTLFNRLVDRFTPDGLSAVRHAAEDALTSWFDQLVANVRGGNLAGVDRRYTGDLTQYSIGVVRRGFVSEIVIQEQHWFGNEWECDNCVDQSPDYETNVIECRRCDSTGMVGTPALGPQLVRSCPLTRVSFFESKPHEFDGQFVWRRSTSYPSPYPSGSDEEATLIPALFDRLASGRFGGQKGVVSALAENYWPHLWSFPTADEATAATSAAALDWARAQPV